MSSPFGATVSVTATDFKVWAPSAQAVEVVVISPRECSVQMRRDSEGVFTASIEKLGAGTCYWFQIDGVRRPDPYSRFQPEGPHGPSQVIDPDAFRWRDAAWRGHSLQGKILYELHVGTFTEAGTFDAAIERLPWLASMGITTIEVMPIAEFPGRFNWGYDGVNLFAPYHGYGDHEALKRFVDAAHQVGLGVVLDVVYNHVGPDGNYLTDFTPNYFSKTHTNDWGTPFNVDGEASAFVRQFLLDNARYWIREFHLDGLRLDATPNIPDSSKVHILCEVTAAARNEAAPKDILIIAEDEQQQASRLLPREAGGFGFDATWNDDFHHTAQVALRGRRHAYLNDYTGTPQEFISSAKRGFLYQGQYYFWQKQPRGERLRTAVRSCIAFLDNHDQVANSVDGARSHHGTSAAKYRALTAFLMLTPQTPLLFMGQEFGATTRFLFFADHGEPLRGAVLKGRGEFLQQFSSIDSPATLASLTDPADQETFRRSKLRWEETLGENVYVNLHRDLISLRRTDLSLNGEDGTSIDGAVLSQQAFVLRWFSDDGDRLLLVNFGVDLRCEPCPEPLLAPSTGKYWALVWSSERLMYGGRGVEHPESDCGWCLPGESAIFLSERSIADAYDEP